MAPAKNRHFSRFILIIIIFIINFFRQVFSECTEAVATSLIPLGPLFLRFVLLSLVLAILCGLKRSHWLAH